MNEAAILAARRGLKEISKEEISDALERIIAGPEKKGAVMTEAKKKLVAYHEVRLPSPAGASSPPRCLKACLSSGRRRVNNSCACAFMLTRNHMP